MLGEYVVRIYDQVRGRPQFVVARHVNFRETPLAASGDEAEQKLFRVAQELASDISHLPGGSVVEQPHAGVNPRSV